MKQRFLFTLLMAIVMMAMSPMKSWAEDVASVTIGGNTTNYDDFTNAFTAAATGTDAEPATLKLLADYQNPSYGMRFLEMISGTMTIDLNGHNITGSGNNMSAIYVAGAKVTITDTSLGTKGKVSGASYALEFGTGSLTILDGVFQGSQKGLYAYNATNSTPNSIVLNGGKFVNGIQVPYSSPGWDLLNMTYGPDSYIFEDESGNKVDIPEYGPAIISTVSVVLSHSHVAGTGDKSHECTLCGKHQSRISAEAGITVTDVFGQSISPEDYIWEGNTVNISGMAPEVSGKIYLGLEATTAEGSKLQIKNNSFAMAGSDVTVSFWYMAIPSDPLCFEALEAGAEIYFNDIVSDYILYYSTDNKQTWTQFNNYDDNYSLPTLANVGDKIYLYGKVTSKSSSDYTSIATDNGKVAASGKLSSILGGATTIPDYGCYDMFVNNTLLVSAPVMSDITKIGKSGCYCMFSCCSSLTTASDMNNLTTIGKYGCESMFDECPLTTAPDMSSLTTVDDFGCNYMFGYCTSLANVSDMNNLTTIGIEGCEMMFMGCEALTTAPDMSNLTTTGYMGCYEMFYECTNLTTAPDMSSLTTIGEYGCGEMFYGCTSLTTAPDMSSLTTIGENGCYEMFHGCTSLTTAPDMNSLTTVGVEGCEEMFSGCTSLTTAPAMHSLRTVGYDGFYLMFDECTNLTGFELNAIPYSDEEGFFDICTSNITLNLSDDSYVYTGSNPNFPTLQSASYTRQMSNEWGTVVVPFDITYAADNGNYKLYQLTAATGENLTFTEYADGADIAAGTPMAVKAVGSKNGAGKYEITLNAATAAINTTITPTTEVDGLTMNGTYTNLTNQTGMYFIAQNKFWLADAAITIAPFRAWFVSDLGNGGNEDAKVLNIVVNDEADGIASVIGADSMMNGKYIENGHVVIVKNGKKFNLNGQEIK